MTRSLFLGALATVALACRAAPPDFTHAKSGVREPGSSVRSGIWGYPAPGEVQWKLFVNQRREGYLEVDGEELRIRISRSEIDRLREVLAEERFFELDGAYGAAAVPCGVYRWVEIRDDGRRHRVVFGSSPADPDGLERISRVWLTVRAWLEDVPPVARRANAPYALAD